MKIYKCLECGIIGIDEIPYCEHIDIEPFEIADTDDKARIVDLEKQVKTVRYKYENALDQIMVLEREISGRDCDIDNLEAKLSKCQKERDKLKVQLASARVENESIQDSIVDLVEKLQDEEQVNTPKCKHGEYEALCEICADLDFELMEEITKQIERRDKNDLHDLVIVGESEYSYKDNYGYIRWKKPIGPQRAAKKRRKI